MPCRVVFLLALFLWPALGTAADGNRLAYLDESDPYYVSRSFPKLVTPQWVGDEGVEAVVVLAIDDMRGPEKWETFLRPILERLQQIDGRAPVSIMTCTIEPDDPHLQKWLKEGLSIEVHTIDHPCPLLLKGDFAAAKSTYDRCVDLMASIPGNKPVAYRMPCCDSRNTNSPRFYAEIFNRTTENGHFLTISTSVFNVLTPNDPVLPRELVIDKEGRERFRKYLPFASFVNTIDDYPYPYVIGRLCWEFPCVTPSDWSAQNLNKPNNPQTVEDLKAALDAVVIKQGVYNLVFHPHGWIRAEQINELIDHAVEKHGRKVKFLTFREAAERLEKNLLAGNPLRTAKGQDNGVRLLDLNSDGFQDVVIGRLEQSADKQPAKLVGITRLWDSQKREWHSQPFPTAIVRQTRAGESKSTGVQFGLIEGKPAIICGSERFPGIWQFDGSWIDIGSKAKRLPVTATPDGQELGVRMRDIDADGTCELIVGRARSGDVLRWDPKQGWHDLPFKLPDQTSIVDDQSRDAGLRFIDVDEDDRLDVLFSNDDRYSLHWFDSMEKGWSRIAISGKRDEAPKVGRGIPPIVTAGANAGAWVHSRHLWWQNESTDRLPDLVDRRSFNELLANVEPRAKSPAASLRSIRVRPGFQVEQVAAEPLVMDPVAFAWGFDGRLWVVEMGDYPLGEDGSGKPGGRVRWLADTDGDGRYDRSQVFLEGLSSPTGVMAWRKGVLVTSAPELLYAEDRDGDGWADHREALYTGFIEGNQQHRVNGLRWGLDNWIHIANGDSGGEIRSAKTGKKVNISGRDLRVRPDTGDIEAVAGKSQFGREQDDWGNWFGNNNSNPLYHFALDERYLRRNPHVPTPGGIIHVPSVPGHAPVFPISRTVPRFNDHHTANRITSACSAILYRDELFGPEFAGNSFVSEPVHNLVHREIVSRQGVSFTSRRADDEQTREFLASSDNYFRPTTIRVGPDGALWIADMYRETIEHPEWIPDDWEKRLDLRAGHEKGRIYRVYPVGVKPREIPRFEQLDAAQLVGLLESPGCTVRDMAQQRLIELQDASVGGALETMARTSKRATARLHALCTLDGLKLLTAERASLLEACLEDQHAALRRHAIRLAEPLLDGSPALLQACLRLVGDADPQVRQQLAYTLGECRDSQSARALAKLLADDAEDPFIAAAAVSSLQADNLTAVFDAVRSKVQQAQPPPQGVMQAIIATAVGLERQRGWVAVAELLSPQSQRSFATWQLRAAASLFQALERNGSSIERAINSAADQRHAKVLRELMHAARRIAVDEAATLDMRAAAIALLGLEQDKASADGELVLKLLSPDQAPAIQSAAVAVLPRFDDAGIGLAVIAQWTRYSPQIRARMIETMIDRQTAATLLLDALETGELQASELAAAQRQRLIDHRQREIRSRAKKLLAATTDENRVRVVERFSKLDLIGDAGRGLAVFEKRCASCHRWGDRGQDVGPDLATLTDRLPGTMLVAIFDPNRAVEAKYASYTAITRQGLSHTGILAQESETSITLVKADGKREALLRSEVEELTGNGKSLMPEGLENELNEQDVADLLTMLGGSPDVR